MKKTNLTGSNYFYRLDQLDRSIIIRVKTFCSQGKKSFSRNFRRKGSPKLPYLYLTSVCPSKEYEYGFNPKKRFLTPPPLMKKCTTIFCFIPGLGQLRTISRPSAAARRLYILCLCTIYRRKGGGDHKSLTGKLPCYGAEKSFPGKYRPKNRIFKYFSELITGVIIKK